MLSLRERGRHRPQAEVVNARLAEAAALLRTSWAMVIVFWVGWASGEGGHHAVRHRRVSLRCASS
jgi:phosphatidate cytidylyltransferase